MDQILHIETEKIRALTSNILSLLADEVGAVSKISTVEKSAAALIRSYRKLIKGAEEHSARREEIFRNALPCVERAYLHWKDIRSNFGKTLRLAYSGRIPRENLLLDSVYSGMELHIGQPLGTLYAKLQKMLSRHLESSPWDAFVSGVGEHPDREEFESALRALVHGDELDVEDAIEDLTSRFESLFVHFLAEEMEKQRDLETFRESFWKRPEIVIANTYWRQSCSSGILDILSQGSSGYFSGGFARARDFLAQLSTAGVPKSPEMVVSELLGIEKSERDKLLRCLAMHPDREIRSYAVTNVSATGFWRAATPSAIPCPTILSLLERVVGSRNFDGSFRKIFFNAIYKRLLFLTSRSDVLYARGIVRILARLDFFMEDEYFDKLMVLLDYLEAKERYYQISGSLLDEYIEKVRAAKEKAGSVQTRPTDFGDVPLVVLRKLAREGHYWYELAMHPVYKIARETIPHINTQDRALRIATCRSVNQDVLRAISKKRPLFSLRSSRLALLSNPRTPITASIEYVSDLSRDEIETLLRKSTIHPELRFLMRKKLDR